MTKLQKAIAKTVAYADIFDYPLTPEEIFKFIISDCQVSFRKFQKMMSCPPAGLAQADGFWFLKGREEIVLLRQRRLKFSRRKLIIARKVGRYLKLVPWVKMVAVTGALAMNNADRDDDIDLLLITAGNRLWLSRSLVVTALSFLGLYRRPDKIKDKICPNVFLDTLNLAVPQKKRDLYSAHEVAQLKPLWERGGVYQNFLSSNLWVGDLLPHVLRKIDTIEENSGVRLRLREGKREKGLFDYLELLARRLQLAYMKSKKTTEVVEPGRVLFHPQDARSWVLKAYRKRLNKLGLEHNLN